MNTTHNISFRMMQNLIFLVIGIIIMPIFYKGLGPEGLGRVSYIDSIATIFSIIAGFGVSRYGVRELNKVNNESIVIPASVCELRTVSFYSHVLVNGAYIAFYFISDIYENTLYTYLFILSLISVNRNLFNVDWVYEARSCFKLISIKNIIVKIVMISVLVCVFYNVEVDSFIYFFYFLTAGFTFISCLVIYIYSVSKGIVTPGFPKLTKKHLSLVKAMIPSLMVVNSYLFYVQVDKIYLGGISEYDTGLYVMGERVSFLIFQFVMTVMLVLMPTTTRMYYKDKERYVVNMVDLIKSTFFIITPVFIGLIVVASDLVLFFGGQEFLGATIYLEMFAVLVFLLSVWRLYSNLILFVAGLEKLSLFVILVVGIGNLVIKLILPNLEGQEILMLTVLAHLLVVSILMFVSIKKVDGRLSLPLFSIVKYGLVSSLFFPLAVFVRSFINNGIESLFCIVLLCVTTYLFFLVCVLRDEIAMDFYRRIKGGLK
jgi:O-antigen/teichoic acid export membrane protein